MKVPNDFAAKTEITAEAHQENWEAAETAVTEAEEDIATGVLQLLVAGTKRRIAWGEHVVTTGTSNPYSQTIKHGLGVKPQMVLVVNRLVGGSWFGEVVSAGNYTETGFTLKVYDPGAVGNLGEVNAGWVAIG